MKTKIVFVHNHLASFVQTDLALLRERYDMREWNQQSRVVNLAALARAIASSDLVFGWFASWHTFFPVILARLLRRPSIVVVGGYDTANLPEIGYGSQRTFFKRWIVRTIMRQATGLITNSNYSRDEAVSNAHAEPGKISVIYHGFAPAPMPPVVKEDWVMTAGNVDQVNLERKGLELFVRAAVDMPAQFVLVGAWLDTAIHHLRAIASPNVQFTGWVSDAELEKYFSSARVYVQVSRHEGFGIAVAEAMQHACVPVVTRAGSLPEVVGDAGVYVDSFEPGAVAEGVRRAFAQASTIGPRARARIEQEFPLEKRREKLFALIDSLTMRTEH